MNCLRARPVLRSVPLHRPALRPKITSTRIRRTRPEARNASLNLGVGADGSWGGSRGGRGVAAGGGARAAPAGGTPARDDHRLLQTMIVLNIGGAGSLTTTQRVLTNATNGVALADVYSLKQPLSPRQSAGAFTVSGTTVDVVNRFVGGGSIEPTIVENGQIFVTPPGKGPRW
jgi:hypothetical protein